MFVSSANIDVVNRWNNSDRLLIYDLADGMFSLLSSIIGYWD